ncbi:MAG: DUF6132 family protein [Flavobacteriaceae bacterium]|nr:DUF6132 family protein [Flavobacteriaceae bacterium]
MQDFLLKNTWKIVGIILGGVAGYLYFLQIGCISGTCAITSNPWSSTSYGAIMGYLLFSMIQGQKNQIRLFYKDIPK